MKNIHIKSLMPWFIGFLTAHWVMRGIAIAAMKGDALLLAHGPFSDAVSALLMALIAVGLARLNRWLPYALLALWCVVLAGNLEFLREWQANLSILDYAGLGEADFIFGSVLTPELAKHTLLLFAVGLAGIWVGHRASARTVLPIRTRWAVPVLFLAAALWPAYSPNVWQQQNVLEDNLRQLTYLALPESGPSGAQVTKAKAIFGELKKQDLDGTQFVKPAPGMNVLVVTVEALSELPFRKEGWMPRLKKMADDNLRYTQVVNPNIVSIRGLYALLCGEFTVFKHYGRDGMARHIDTRNVQCLPKILGEHGYKTLYLQNAGIGFQDARGVTTAMGFETSCGNECYKKGRQFSTWGIDDPSLFKEAQKRIEAMEKESKSPWLVTLLTTGTHHPYSVDPSFEPELANEKRQRAFRYTDQALYDLVSWLESTGRLQKTLVVIAGDESRDYRPNTKTRMASAITHNQGFLTILTPAKDKKLIEAIHVQSDLPISVLDYLKITPPETMSGRSYFREYEKRFRPFVFADYTQNMLSLVNTPTQLINCSMLEWRCKRFPLNEGPLFGRSQTFDNEKPHEPDLLQALHKLNQRHWKKITSPQKL